MGVYTRFKQKGGEGFRSLVELLESTPQSRRQKMIDVGNAEDADYTAKALSYMMTFQDVLALPDMELCEVMIAAPPRTIAFAIRQLDAEVKTRFLKCCSPQIAAQIKDSMNMNIGPREVGGAQLKMVEVTRQLEKKGLVRAKKIPLTP